MVSTVDIKIGPNICELYQKLLFYYCLYFTAIGHSYLMTDIIYNKYIYVQLDRMLHTILYFSNNFAHIYFYSCKIFSILNFTIVCTNWNFEPNFNLDFVINQRN